MSSGLVGRTIRRSVAWPIQAQPALYYLDGYSARAAGDYDDALVAFRRALAIEPDNAEVLANVGFIASERGQDEEAERLLRRAIALVEAAMRRW